MKLTYAQLKFHFLKNLAPAYIIAGDEWWLKQEAVKLIRQAAKKANFHEYITLTVDAQFDWEQLYVLLYSTSLIAEKRVIQLKLNGYVPNKIASDILCQYAAKYSLHHLLLIEMGKVETKTAKLAWFQALEKIGHLITIWPISREQFPQWIIERAHQYKLQINQDAAILLTEYVEGNLAAAAQALEKLYLLQPTCPIDTTIIKAVANHESIFTIFDFIDSLIAGNQTRALHILQCLQSEGVEPTFILWGITRELRLLAEFAQKISQGISLPNLFQNYRVFSHRQSIIHQFLLKHSASDCWQYLMHAADIDRLIKGLLTGNVWNALQIFCLRLTI
jgi:DNA polymerase-3 subunit delta